MRTTLTLEDDVARLVREAAHRERRSTKEVVNAAIRRALSPSGVGRKRHLFKVVSHPTTLQPGIDPAGLNQLIDEIEVETFVEGRRKL
jgi:hypothetical protein